MDNRPIKKPRGKWWMLGGITFILIAAIGSSNSSTPTSSAPIAPSVVQTANQYEQSVLSNDNYYTNSSGNTVHAPAYSNEVPVGATAQCADGTYSFSQHRSGTCSHHGGVATWL